MTFYGEALGLDWANAVTGTVASSGAPMHYLYRDTDAQTVMAGDSFLAGIYNNAEQIVSGDAAVISWVVETTAGSSGTLAFKSGLDPTWGLTDPSLASEDLGSRTVTGAQTIVLAQTGITAADIVAGADQPALLVQCASGSVSIAQIRLRVWPPGGPAGGWASGASYTTAGNHFRYRAGTTFDTGFSYATPGDAWAGGRTGFDGAAPSTWLRTGTPAIESSVVVNDHIAQEPTDPTPYASLFYRGVAYLEFAATEVTGGPTGTGIHPDIVPGDSGRSVRAVGGGPLLTQFASWNGGVRVAGTPSATVTLDNTPLSLTLISGSEYAGPVPFALTGVSAVQNDLVPLPADPQLTVGIVTPWWFSNPNAEITEQQSASLENVSANAVVPDYQWWDPTLPWRQPRFFVKDYEGDWRPVGFGKPATDTSRFHVWTPVGWYVECLDGETYSNAHPLKVKLYDGTWDTVAHMRPL